MIAIYRGYFGVGTQKHDINQNRVFIIILTRQSAAPFVYQYFERGQFDNEDV